MANPRIDRNGTKTWYLNEVYPDGVSSQAGILHREDGPAIEYASGTKAWYLNGVQHREDGPAVESASGTRIWWLHGVLYTEDEFRLIQFNNKVYIKQGVEE
jgi:hypothetical protein